MRANGAPTDRAGNVNRAAQTEACCGGNVARWLRCEIPGPVHAFLFLLNCGLPPRLLCLGVLRAGAEARVPEAIAPLASYSALTNYEVKE